MTVQLITWLTIIGGAACAQLPFHASTRVAIIGAGSAGSSAAYHLHQFAPDVNVTVFERNSYIGGRSTSIQIQDDPAEVAELGASVFVDANYILGNASETFNLELEETQGLPDTIGIWNGQRFIYTQTMSAGWLDWVKLVWRYGLSPMRAQRAAARTLSQFLALYEKPMFPWPDLSNATHTLGLLSLTGSSALEYLQRESVSSAFARDIVQSATRVNYGQNVDEIHALEAMVCLVTDGAKSIAGGNWQIFQKFLQSSGAEVRLNSEVSSIQSGPNGWSLDGEAFDMVIMAAPFHLTGIQAPVEVEEPQYVRLHVTLFTTMSPLSESYFGQSPPDVILTTKQEMKKSPPFNSISLLRIMKNGQYLYKVFSPQEFDPHILHASPTWVYRHVWNAYPRLLPRVSFERMELAHGFFYSSGIESFISTMETSALMGKNIAALIHQRLDQSR